MRFGEQFEFHRIPEWYHKYLNYHALKLQIEIFKDGCDFGKPSYKSIMDTSLEPKSEENNLRDSIKNFKLHRLVKLPGFYYLNINTQTLLSLNSWIKPILNDDKSNVKEKADT